MRNLNKTKVAYLQDQTDLRKLVSKALKHERGREGSDIFYLCPFHNEESGSLCLWKHKHTGVDILYCFGCGWGGRALRFVGEFYRLRRHETLEYLMKYNNISYKQLKEATMKKIPEVALDNPASKEAEAALKTTLKDTEKLIHGVETPTVAVDLPVYHKQNIRG